MSLFYINSDIFLPTPIRNILYLVLSVLLLYFFPFDFLWRYPFLFDFLLEPFLSHALFSLPSLHFLRSHSVVFFLLINLKRTFCLFTLFCFSLCASVSLQFYVTRPLHSLSLSLNSRSPPTDYLSPLPLLPPHPHPPPSPPVSPLAIFPRPPSPLFHGLLSDLLHLPTFLGIPRERLHLFIASSLLILYFFFFRSSCLLPCSSLCFHFFPTFSGFFYSLRLCPLLSPLIRLSNYHSSFSFS